MKAAATAIVPVQPGEILAGKYRVERVIGSGGMGVVLAARHVELGHLVAIKLLLPDLADRRDVVERFLREARAVVQLRSEHAVRVLDVGLHHPPPSAKDPRPLPYMVMEHLDGTSLFGLLARGPLPVAEAVEHVAQACEAIDEAHRLGIVHRDIKPDNLFLTRKPSGAPLVKVLDFGISRLPDGEGAARLTGQADVMGTPLYMAPEQMKSARNADPRSDVWALGATLYELLAGRAAFAGINVAEICSRVLTAVPASPAALRPEVPEELSSVVMRCLEKTPDGRFASAADLASALGPFRLAPPARMSDPGADMPPPPVIPVLQQMVSPATTAGVTTGVAERRASLRWGLLSFGAGTAAIACVVLILALLRGDGASATAAPPPLGPSAAPPDKPGSTQTQPVPSALATAPPKPQGTGTVKRPASPFKDHR